MSPLNEALAEKRPAERVCALLHLAIEIERYRQQQFIRERAWNELGVAMDDWRKYRGIRTIGACDHVGEIVRRESVRIEAEAKEEAKEIAAEAEREAEYERGLKLHAEGELSRTRAALEKALARA